MVGRIRHMTPTVVCSSRCVLRLCGERRGPESGCGRRVPTPTFRPYHHPGRAGSRAAGAVRPAQASLPDAARPIEGRAGTGVSALECQSVARSGAGHHHIVRNGRNGEPGRLGQGGPDQHTTLVTPSVGGNDMRFADVVTSCVNPDGIIMTGHAEADSRPVSMKPFHPNLLGLRPGLRVGAVGSWGSPGARRPGKCRGGSARHGQEGDPTRRATGSGGRPDPEGDRIRRATRSEPETEKHGLQAGLADLSGLFCARAKPQSPWCRRTQRPGVDCAWF